LINNSTLNAFATGAKRSISAMLVHVMLQKETKV